MSRSLESGAPRNLESGAPRALESGVLDQTWTGSTTTVGTAGASGSFSGVTTWTGSVATVGVSGKTGYFFTGPIPGDGLVGWWDANDASTFTYSSGVLASQWGDKSPVGNHVVQATVGRQPSRNGTRNGLTTVVFDGARGMGVTPAVKVGALPNEAWTFFVMVVKTGAAMTFEAVFNMVSSNQGRYWDAYNNSRYGASVYNSTGTSPDYRTAFPDLSLYRVRVKRGTPYAQLILINEEVINGVVQRSTTAGDNTGWDTTGQEIWIGARADMQTFLRGEIGEVVLYDRYLDNAETASVEQYLTDKWLAQTWVGSTTTAGVAGASGSFVGGAVTWTGSTATVAVSASSGALTPGDITWVGSTATVGAAGTSGSFAAGTATWSGSQATIGVSAASDVFIPGTAIWGGGPPVLPTFTPGVSAGNSASATQTLTLPTNVPVANAKHYVAVAFGRSGHSGALSANPITDSLGSVWSQVALSNGAHLFGAGYGTYYGLYVCDVGASPATRTITLDPFSTTDTAWMTMRSFSAVNGTIEPGVTSAISNASNSVSVTLTAAAAPTPNGTSVAIFGSNTDTPFRPMAAIATWPDLMNQNAGAYATCSVFYKDGNTSTTVTQTDLGQSINSNGGVFVSFAGVAGTGSVITVGVLATSGSFSEILGQGWTGSVVTVGVAGTSGSFIGGATTWTGGSSATAGVAGTSGVFVSDTTWVGSTTTVGVSATSGSFAPGTTAWTGSQATVGVTGTSGSFVPGTAPWIESTQTVGVAGTSGVFVAGDVTWVGSTAIVGVSGVSGSFASGTNVWTGSVANVAVAATSDVFTGGATTWTGGSAGTIGVAGASGALVPGTSAWTGSEAVVGVSGLSGSWSSAFSPQTWLGSLCSIGFSTPEGIFGTDQTWVGSTATIGAAGTSGTFIPGATTWAGSVTTIGMAYSTPPWTGGAASWVGSVASAGVAGASAPFVPGVTTWIGSQATIGVAGTSGALMPGTAPWTGSSAELGMAGTSDAFTPGTVAWMGSQGTVTFAVPPGSFTSAITWDGSPAVISIVAVIDTTWREHLTWHGGSEAIIEVATLSGAFMTTGLVAMWADTNGVLHEVVQMEWNDVPVIDAWMEPV